MKLPSLLFEIVKVIEEYLNSRYNLNSSIKVSRIKENKIVSGPYEETILFFKIVIFVSNKFDLLAKKDILANAVKLAISKFDKHITRISVEFLDGEQIGEYSTIDYSIKIEFLKEIKKTLGKYKFISRD